MWWTDASQETPHFHQLMKAFHQQFQRASESRRYKDWVPCSFSSLSKKKPQFCILQKLKCLPWWRILIGINTVLLTCKQYYKSKSITFEKSLHTKKTIMFTIETCLFYQNISGCFSKVKEKNEATQLYPQ